MTETAADRTSTPRRGGLHPPSRHALSPVAEGLRLLKEWRALGVPVEAIEQGIDEAFSRRKSGRPREGSTRSRIAATRCWRPGNAARKLASAAEKAERRQRRSAGSREPRGEACGSGVAAAGDVGSIEGARRSVGRLASSQKTPAEIEVSLARLDRRLAASLLDALPEAERGAIAEEAAHRVAAASGRMDEAAALRTVHALERRLLRERLDCSADTPVVTR